MPQKRVRAVVTREEFDRLNDRLDELVKIVGDLQQNYDIQFTRIVQLQAEVDHLNRAHVSTT